MSTAADKPVRHILSISGGKPAPCFPAFDMLGPILTRHYPKPIVGGSCEVFKVGDMSLKSPKKASELTVNCAELKAAAKRRIDQQTDIAGIKSNLHHTERAFRRGRWAAGASKFSRQNPCLQSATPCQSAILGSWRFDVPRSREDCQSSHAPHR